MPRNANWQLKVRMGLDIKERVKALARRRRLSICRLVESLLERELDDAETSGAHPDEQAIRDMATLVAVEQILKIQEASIPGGTTLSRRLLGEAADAAIARLELIETFLRGGRRD
jgi:hypothetical protein